MTDLVRIGRAILTNAIARVAPASYLKLTGQTGRGEARSETAEDIAAYFVRCVEAYCHRLGVNQICRLIDGQIVVEYGPGDCPGVALLLLAKGASKVYCVDRFPMVTMSAKNVEVLRCLRSRLSVEEAARFDGAFIDAAEPGLGFNRDRLEYVVSQHGLSGLQGQANLVLSRAVLEHVDDLPGTFADMKRALKDGGVALHQVDLRSHGLHRNNPLDFLEWPNWLWALMYSHKGVPNRWRANRYREIVTALGVENILIETTSRVPAITVREARPRLAAPFHDLDEEDLACLGLWVQFCKTAAVQ